MEQHRLAKQTNMERHAGAARLSRRTSGWLIAPLVGLAVTALLTVMGRLGDWFWWLDLWGNFRFHYFYFALLMALVFLVARRWKIVAIAMVTALANMPPAIDPPRSNLDALEIVSSARPLFKIVSFNVQKSNRRYGLVREFLRREAADIIILQEVNAAWKGELEVLSEEYPYRFIHASETFYGLALFSKIPWEKVEYLPFAETSGTPIIKGRFMLGNRFFTFLGTKTFPPTSGPCAARRAQQLSKLGEIAEKIEGPLILAGDFNATSWSRAFATFQQKSRQQWNGGGQTPSWPSLLGWAGIKIDHIMVNSGLSMQSLSSGPNVGSDHLPVIAVVVL